MAAFRQLKLLMWKNLLILWRSKIWTILEIILPLIIAAPYIWGATKAQDSYRYDEKLFPLETLTGSAVDVVAKHDNNQIIDQWGSGCAWKFAYSSANENADVDKLMSSLAHRYDTFHNTTNRQIDFWSFEAVKFASESEMLAKLNVFEGEAWEYYYTRCRDNDTGKERYIGGVFFNKFDLSSAQLDYKFLLPNPQNYHDWCLDKSWMKTDGEYTYLEEETYWESGFISLQTATDSIFTEMSTNSSETLELLTYQPMPMKSRSSFRMTSFIEALPFLCLYLITINTTRNISQEKATTKEFLSVMGLSTPMFYLSHALFAFAKCIIVIFPSVGVLSISLQGTSVTVLLVMMFLSSCATVAFSCLMASLFKSANIAVRVAALLYLLVAAVIYICPSPSDLVGAGFASLDFYGAIHYCAVAMGEAIDNELPFTWSSVFEGSSNHFTAGIAMCMLVVDTIWMSALALLIDMLLRNNEWTIGSIFSAILSICKRSDENDDSEDVREKTIFEVDNRLNGVPVGIEVDGLTKVWLATGERAVDDISFKAHQGNVTVLLGHNGAGKSTTFSAIAGLVNPTKGHIAINNFDLVKDRSSARFSMGLCPQANCLFDKLTVNEHLKLIAGFKGVEQFQEEADRLTSTLQIADKRNELSHALSGGMKRKLCVSMALIGESRVVLLDEPTAGMDPGARRDVTKLLVEEKQKRTLLLTTHYMDEAEALGDRIVIMGKGRIYCDGSPEFLKKSYDSGYILNVNFTDGSLIERGSQSIREMLARAGINGERSFKAHAKQLETTLPISAVRSFPAFCKELEENESTLGISSFGISLHNLEQVFHKVVEGTAARQENEERARLLNEKVVKSQLDPKRSPLLLSLARFATIQRKRFLYSLRNLSQVFLQTILPLLFLAALLIVAGVISNWQPNHATFLKYDAEKILGRSNVPVQTNSTSDISNSYLNLMSKEKNFYVKQFTKSDNLAAGILEMKRKRPYTGIGASFGNHTVTMLFSLQNYHSLPVTVNMFGNAKLQNGFPKGSISISLLLYTGNETRSNPYNDDNDTGGNPVDPAVPFVIFASLALLTSTFVMFLVEERVSQFRHQQILTGISPILYWSSMLFYDFIFYWITCGLFLIIFAAAKLLTHYIGLICLTWLIYFCACMPTVYTTSLIFATPSRANAFLIAWQVMLSAAAILFILLIQGFISKSTANVVKTILYFLLPSFSMCEIMSMISVDATEPIQYKENLMDWKHAGKPLVLMAIFALLSSIVFVALQFKSIQYSIYRMFNKSWKKYKVNVESQDSTVIMEETTLKSEEDLSLDVRDLTKRFGKFTAIERLSFDVRNRECFGLLGVNGSGKTTTFDILTGRSFASGGTANVAGKPVTEQVAIGYCPQFDAMMLDFSGRETLEMLASLHGFHNVREKAELILSAVGMTGRLADKLVRHYSGGQRRKISVGMAMISATRIVILDEPTAGIDPTSRRDIWSVLMAIRDHSASSLLLTTHSMDECEALCSRIGILKNGHLVAIGSSQWLKSRFGNSYTLTIAVPTMEMREEIADKIASTFVGASLRSNEESLNLRWQIEKQPSDRWSTMFSRVISICDQLGVDEFFLAQPSLEETFLNVAVNSDLDTNSL